jgi:hypothetical protein
MLCKVEELENEILRSKRTKEQKAESRQIKVKAPEGEVPRWSSMLSSSPHSGKSSPFSIGYVVLRTFPSLLFLFVHTYPILYVLDISTNLYGSSLLNGLSETSPSP